MISGAFRQGGYLLMFVLSPEFLFYFAGSVCYCHAEWYLMFCSVRVHLLL